MSICIISDHIIMLRQNFIVILQHIDQVKPTKYEGGGGFSPQSPPPLDPPLACTVHTADYIMCWYNQIQYTTLTPHFKGKRLSCGCG